MQHVLVLAVPTHVAMVGSSAAWDVAELLPFRVRGAGVEIGRAFGSAVGLLVGGRVRGCGMEGALVLMIAIDCGAPHRWGS